jgi:hypothetical protein
MKFLFSCQLSAVTAKNLFFDVAAGFSLRNPLKADS